MRSTPLPPILPRPCTARNQRGDHARLVTARTPRPTTAVSTGRHRTWPVMSPRAAPYDARSMGTGGGGCTRCGGVRPDMRRRRTTAWPNTAVARPWPHRRLVVGVVGAQRLRYQRSAFRRCLVQPTVALVGTRARDDPSTAIVVAACAAVQLATSACGQRRSFKRGDHPVQQIQQCSILGIVQRVRRGTIGRNGTRDEARA